MYKTILIWLMLVSFVNAQEYWAGLKKDGNNQNSNLSEMSDDLKILWNKNFTDFPIQTSYKYKIGRRSNNLCIRNGEILYILPDVDAGKPVNVHRDTQAAYISKLDLNTGEQKIRYRSNINRHSALQSMSGVMDSSMVEGLILLYWSNNGIIHAGIGGDYGRYFSFKDNTGEAVTSLIPAYGANLSGYFNMTDKLNNAYIVSGSGGHSTLVNGNSTFGILGTNRFFLNSNKHYGSVLDGNYAFGFKTNNIIRESVWMYEGYGTILTSYDVTNGKIRWTKKELNKSFFPGGNHCEGSIRPHVIDDNGNVYFYGYYTNNLTGIAQNVDHSKGMHLTGYNKDNGIELLSVNIPWIYDTRRYAWQTQTKWMVPQISSIKNRIVIFQPHQSVDGYASVDTKPSIACVDTETKKLLWEKSFDLNLFNNKVEHSWMYDRKKAVQFVCNYNNAYIIDPYLKNNNLSMNLHIIDLNTGSVKKTLNYDILDNQQNPISNITDIKSICCRDIALVDGKIVVLIDYVTSNLKTSQNIIVLGEKHE